MIPITKWVFSRGYEGPNDIHTVGRNASKTMPAKFLVVFLKDKDAPVLIPAKWLWRLKHRGACPSTVSVGDCQFSGLAELKEDAALMRSLSRTTPPYRKSGASF